MCAALMVCLCASGQQKLVILHTHDTHSAVMPMGANLDDTLIAGRGGSLRRMELLRRERRRAPGLLLFDSGDFSQGSPYYTLFRGDVEVGLMNLMGYDAAALGNHEFDCGLDNLARLLRRARFPVVCANCDFTGTPLEGLVRPYVTIRRQGLKIGVFGLLPRLEGLVAHENYEGVRWLDPVETASRVAWRLKWRDSCDVVVCDLWGKVGGQFGELQARGIPTAFDGADRPWDPDCQIALPHTDYLFFSTEDGDTPQLRQRMTEYGKLGPRLVTAMLGSQGSLCWDGNDFHPWGIVPCPELVDSLGAGDSYIAGFLVALGEGKTLEQAMEQGARTATETLGYFGAW